MAQLSCARRGSEFLELRACVRPNVGQVPSGYSRDERGVDAFDPALLLRGIVCRGVRKRGERPVAPREV